MNQSTEEPQETYFTYDKEEWSNEGLDKVKWGRMIQSGADLSSIRHEARLRDIAEEAAARKLPTSRHSWLTRVSTFRVRR